MYTKFGKDKGFVSVKCETTMTEKPSAGWPLDRETGKTGK